MAKSRTGQKLALNLKNGVANGRRYCFIFGAGASVKSEIAMGSTMGYSTTCKAILFRKKDSTKNPLKAIQAPFCLTPSMPLPQCELAIADYAKAIVLDPTDSIAINNRSLVYDKIGIKKEAKADRQKAHELDPESYDA